ncbi:unnamed protein product [Hydatigera taeniaeformis]|uniref:Uncharacterized protein n=1 Tax=Hydatigena taeniaeformis TaxID=6205 RepID=A0A0R3XDG7_HYDTA|nr:unnamed protein product [Hydatigera taeniaeformis]
MVSSDMGVEGEEDEEEEEEDDDEEEEEEMEEMEREHHNLRATLNSLLDSFPSLHSCSYATNVMPTTQWLRTTWRRALATRLRYDCSLLDKTSRWNNAKCWSSLETTGKMTIVGAENGILSYRAPIKTNSDCSTRWLT